MDRKQHLFVRFLTTVFVCFVITLLNVTTAEHPHSSSSSSSLSSSLSLSSPSEILLADWQVKDTFLFGEPLSIQEFRTTFHTPPHFIETVGCPRDVCSLSHTPPDCDYTDCSLISPSQCHSYSSACAAGLTWTHLYDDVPMFVPLLEHPSNTYKQFRFFYNKSLSYPSAVPTDGCHAISISVNPSNGDPDLYVSFSPPYATAVQYDLHQGNHIGDSLVICPDESVLNSSMTLYISVFSFRQPASYNITVTVVPLPVYVPPVLCVDPGNSSQCLTDGVPEMINNFTNYTYTPQLPSSAPKGTCPIAYIEVHFHSFTIVLSQKIF